MRVALNGLFLGNPATGTGQYLRELVPELIRQAPHDEFVFISPYADNSAPAPVFAEPTATRGGNLAKVEFEHWSFPRGCVRAGATLAHIPHFGPPLFPSVPTVVTIHDAIPLVLRAYRGSFAVQLYTRLAAYSARRAQLILADSEASARDIETRIGIPRRRIRVVYLAAAPRYQPVREHDQVARVLARYNLTDKFILYLGGFDIRKNVEQLFRAFAALDTEQTAEYKLVLAGELPTGDSPFFPDPQRFATQYGIADRVAFPGFIAEQDKPALYSAARAFLYPSTYEGFGLPPLEAMSCGAPVLSSRSGSLVEVVGEGGLLLDPLDTASWREGIQKVLSDDQFCDALRAKALAQARRFSWSNTARETLEAYRFALSGKVSK